MIDLLSRFKGAMVGLAVGDALGAPYEFRTPAEPIKNYRDGGRLNMLPGEWTDDTAMALCLAESLINKCGFDLMEQMELYNAWLFKGYMSTRKTAIGTGGTTRDAITRFSESIKEGNKPNPVCGVTNPEKAGNGSIMRLAPVPLFFWHNLEKVSQYSAESSTATHGAPECTQSCAVMGQIIARLASGHPKGEAFGLNPWPSLKWYHNITEPKVVEIVAASYMNIEEDPKPQGAYVIDTLKAALWCVAKTQTFEDAVIKAVNIPGDRDTLGAVVGQIAGTLYGFEAIPEQWVKELMQTELIQEMATKLYHAAISKSKVNKIKDIFESVGCPAYMILRNPRAGLVVDNIHGMEFSLPEYAVIHEGYFYGSEGEDKSSIIYDWQNKNNVEIMEFNTESCSPSPEALAKELKEKDGYEVVWCHKSEKD